MTAAFVLGLIIGGALATGGLVYLVRRQPKAYDDLIEYLRK